MLIDIGVACAWIAMSLVGAAGLEALRRLGSDATLTAEPPCRDGDEISLQEPYSLEPPAFAGLVAG